MSSSDGKTAEQLHTELRDLRAKFAETAATLPADWKLTPTEEKFFRVLLACEIATPDAIDEGAGVKSRRTQTVHISRLRPKLLPFKVEIETVNRRGWRLIDRPAWLKALGLKTPSA